MTEQAHLLLGATLIEDLPEGGYRYLRVTNPPPLNGKVWETTDGPRTEDQLRAMVGAVVKTMGHESWWADPRDAQLMSATLIKAKGTKWPNS